MTTELLFRGVLLGALATFPLGPVGMLCLQRVQKREIRAGLASTAGIAVASALWCLAAVQGMGQLAQYLPLSARAWHFVLGSVLAALALRGLLRPSTLAQRTWGGRELAGRFLATTLLVVANPITLVTVVALLDALGLGKRQLPLAAGCELALGVLAGGLGLWLVIAGVMRALGDRLADAAAMRGSRWLNLGALALGAAYIMSAVWPHFCPAR